MFSPCVCVCVFYLTEASSSSGTSTLRLQATRSPSVAIWLRGALLCIWRTPSIWPLRRKPTLGGECTSVGEPTDPDEKRHQGEGECTVCYTFFYCLTLFSSLHCMLEETIEDSNHLYHCMYLFILFHYYLFFFYY